jgi:hypothetical protein
MSTDRVASMSVDRDLRLLNKLLSMSSGSAFTITFIKGSSTSNPYSIEDAIEFIDRVRIENLYDALSISKVSIDDVVLSMSINSDSMDTIDYKYDESYSNCSIEHEVEYTEYADRIHTIERKACRSIKPKVVSYSDNIDTKLVYTIIMLLCIISLSLGVFITVLLLK